MQPPDENDGAMRQEVLDALEANPTAPFTTVLGNWRDRQNGVIDVQAEARLAAIYDEERADAEEHPRRHYHGGRRSDPWRFS